METGGESRSQHIAPDPQQQQFLLLFAQTATSTLWCLLVEEGTSCSNVTATRMMTIPFFSQVVEQVVEKRKMKTRLSGPKWSVVGGVDHLVE